MTILIDLSDRLIAERIDQFLTAHGHDAFVVNGGYPTNGISPDVLLVCIATLTNDLLARYPQAKTLLVDDPFTESHLHLLLPSLAVVHRYRSIPAADTGFPS